MPKLSSEDDRQEVETAVSSGGGFIKLEEGHNFIVLLDEDFKHNFVHWVHVGDKVYRRICRGEIKGGGWAPDICEICALAAEQYELKKEAKAEGDKALAEEYNKRGNSLRAGYASAFLAVKLKTIVERKKDKRTGKPVKKYVPDYDDIEVGKLQLTHAQTKKVLALVNIDEETGELPYDFITTGDDLVNRPLDFIKKKEAKRLYAEVQNIRPAEGLVEFEIEETEIPDITGEFDFIDDLDKVVALYRGEAEGEEEEDYEEQEIDKKAGKGKGVKGRKVKEKEEGDI